MDASREPNPELERILEAEREARAAVDSARVEAARIQEEGRRLAAQRMEAARAACTVRREQAHGITVERAQPEVARIRAEGRARCHALIVAARRRESAAVDAAEAALLGGR